ncbi:pyridoxamine 5'-phosphate oxidase-related, FMN-binding protein [Streptomyces globisporus]|uniref:Pyridoxamine 5'-phosphate oxidase-related, FMN-binding protein n=2 Tax=Streptomyces TaxID=1883 RepID=A0ABN8UXK0_STRGL|nr:pyridoxamine 5'-phosphate oxidase-related, FMN-binding protein [Streptomyces globisporus]
MLTREELPTEVGDAFAAKDGWDPRKDHPSYVFFRVTPQVLQAWGTVPEMTGRTLMRDGKWLV